MPLYEYTCQNTGLTIELIRPMADADKPVTDAELAAALPESNPGDRATSAEPHKPRLRAQTLHLPAQGRRRQARPLPSPGLGGGCGCGNPHGPCNT